MHEIPECLSRRYKALDELIKELTKSAPQQGAPEGCAHSRGTDVGIKLLCNFWNILKEDPDYDLVHAVQQKLGLTEQPREEGHAFCPERIACYMAGKCCRKNDSYDQGRESHHKYKKMCSSNDNNPKCCASRSVSPIGGSEVLPLSKVLCNLKEAASFDKKCNVRINELMETQKVLQDQIQHLEHREKEGVQLLKQADCMWTCMEDTYNKKINESSERQKILMQQLKELETSTTKWRKNKKDLELQLVSVSKCHEEIKEKINQKNSDFKCMDVEIEDFKKRLENNKRDMEAVKKSFGTKKQASEAKISKIAAEISSLEKVVIQERRLKNNKEQEGSQYVQEARAELQKICKVLLQKKIENEDLRSQKEALNFELAVLKQTYDQCKDKCKNRQQEISDEIAKVEKQIKEFKVKCSRCHECTDTVDIRRCCTDCPRCVEQRDCILEMDHCSPDHTMDCVCTTVKKKFLDNVFDNMYTVLERQVKTGPGKAVADAVLNSLKRSRNGKLDVETRKVLQEFILTTVKKNLNLTIVGGAVKTRCEMDPDTYNQLMLCLQQVKVVKPPKEDKATPAKKDSCRRWGGVSECNCPKGPKACICLKKAPPPPQDPSPCPPPTHDKEEEGVVIKCPHRDTAACGADCAMHAVPSRVGANIAAWRPDPCKEQSCRFSNMRAAQCMLGPESLVSLPKGYMTTIPQVPVLQDLDGLMTCKCGHGPTKPCNCQDRTSQPRERIIEEVMGRYGDIPPIDKVISEDGLSVAETNRRKHSVQNYMSSDINEICACQSKITIPHNILPLATIYTTPMQKHEKTENNCSKYELVTLYYNNSENNEFVKSNKVNNGIHAGIATDKLHSQFTESCSKKTKNVELDLIELHEVQTTDKTDEYIPTTDMFEKKVCDTVKKLLKGIIVRDEVNNMRNESKCEWVTVDSLIREITSLTKISKDNKSDVAHNEVEIKVESLENLKTNKQHNIIQDANKSVKNRNLQQMQLQFIFDNLIDSDLVKKITTKCDESFPKVSTNDSKQLKAGILKSCDNVTCRSLWDEVKEKINRSFSLENEIGKDTYSQKYSVEESKKVPSFLAHVLSGDQRYLSTEVSLPEKSYDSKSVAFIKDTKEEKIKQHFKVIINDADLVGDQFTELKTTESGNLALELDEQVIRLIEEKLTENQSVFVSLDEIDSENYVINFSPLEKTNNKRRRISIKTTTSGTKCLEIRKEFLNKLKHNELNNNIINKQPETDQVNNTSQAICDCKDHAENVYKVPNIKNASNQKIYLSKLERLWDDGTKDIFIKVVGQNGLCKEIKGTLTKNSSGDIIVDVTNISSLGEITLKSGDCPAVFTPTNSNSFLLEICHDDNNFNVILRRSTVGRIILLATESSSKPQCIYDSRPKNELFRVKIQISNKLVEEPHVVLKMTASRNYTFVLDKEYEKTFANTIDECIGDDSECFVELNKTNSGNFLVVLDDNDMLDGCVPNALLTKSPSGHIKMIVQEPTYETLDSISPKKMSTSSSRAFSLLLDKLPPSTQQIKRDSFKTPLTHTKSCSDSRLHDKVKMKLPDENVLSEPSVALTRTASGQYMVLLNKESKKAFVNQLRSYLIGSHGLIPIKRTETGEITIKLNNNSENNNCGYGSSKISPSGNIYVTVDENIIEGLVEDVKCSEGSSLDEVLSKHIIESIKNPVHKSVTTTCNAKPESCSCDVSKCVCKELQFDHDWWFQNSSSYLKSRNRCVDLKKVGKKSSGGDKIYNPQKYKEPCCVGSKSKDSAANKSPHIITKPCDCSPVVPENPRSEECCYVVEAICPNHIDKCKTVPNKLMAISAFSNNTLQKRNHAVVYPRIKTKDNAARDRSWDSLNYLPQQLPRFLQDVNFR